MDIRGTNGVGEASDGTTESGGTVNEYHNGSIHASEPTGQTLCLRPNGGTDGETRATN